MLAPPYTNLNPPDADKLAATGFLRMAPDGTADGGRLLRRYADLTVLDVGRRLRAPAQLQGPAEIGRWLDGLPAAAKGASAYQELVRAIDAIAPGDKAATVAAAARLHRWREELLNGR